jgi:hypothetical protein
MIRFGWATRDFTPNRPTLLFGQMHVRVAHKARDPLMLTALAMDDDTSAGRAIWIACDLCCISEALVQGVRERLASRLPDGQRGRSTPKAFGQ